MPPTPPDRPDFFTRHRALLEEAVAATAARDHWTPYPESPSRSAYGEDAAKEGEAAYRASLGGHFELPGHPGHGAVAAAEKSPYGFALGVTYPRVAPQEALSAARTAMVSWRDAGPDARAGVAAEILARLNASSFEIAHAVQHTTGQAFVMAFQAGGPHAQDRGLEAVALAWAEQSRHPATARWNKPRPKGAPLVMDKKFTPVGRGVALLIACNTFPTWNGYPGLFASLVTGNPVVVKPHPGAVLPLAITVRVAREVLAEAGFDPNVVILAAESPEERTASVYALHPDVRIIDFTGSTEFGDWLETHARQAVVHTEKAGLNTVVLDSTDDYRGLLGNLAFSLSLYSGQMCTTPQNLLIPRDGIATDQGVRSADDFAVDLGAALDRLLGDPARAAGTLGAIVGDGVRARLEEAAGLGRTVRASAPVEHPEYPEAVVRTPLVARLDAESDREIYTREWFGPVSFVIGTDSTEHSLAVLRETVRAHGALTAAVHSTSEDVLATAESAALDAGVHLSENLTGAVFVNQSAAFSDFHGSAANPAASATLSDPAFVTGRFATLQSRRPVPAEESAHV
ncbi:MULTISPECIES: phenylacetic acid degradation protein PaaN [Streptomyces]|uniref:Phenylacetic acid degradation protein PaaN n=1 Tax=Streptomyces caniscabiei TaxID=2746961 RepID=A0ABU4N7S2_9ACTN|nr:MULTISPECIES: phenylacetic acid degradation protein PaaN [Streptomyces]MBE4739057.1 phenylacetic acid degradation protein PaaN [Streptomyces caniscabiei]MBE4762663.1 phenylacetic acid degradation protein PaaN [Streptomyces caniscabiei]MBE4772010.1 phenylacetic acid degradation protein PaaN [Streptomyces caniscabiei]MBE4788071.1 phenylacetic acid degradation protein PaaN [Streptomyces caniscabiei]MBE4797293.1 phenylacetic acid degradation protein PaaN [Streptomyces caniscabiei]